MLATASTRPGHLMAGLPRPGREESRDTEKKSPDTRKRRVSRHRGESLETQNKVSRSKKGVSRHSKEFHDTAKSLATQRIGPRHSKEEFRHYERRAWRKRQNRVPRARSRLLCLEEISDLGARHMSAIGVRRDHKCGSLVFSLFSVRWVGEEKT